MGRRKKMQTRTITVDYARPRGYDVGYRAENNFTLLALPIPAELEGADSYRVYFESTVGEYLQTELLTPADGYVTVEITSDVVPEPGNMAAQLVAFADGEIVGYAPMITGSAKASIPDGTKRLSHSLAAEIALNTAARHSHDNRSVLDKLSAADGKLQYDGSGVGLKGEKGDKGDTGATPDIQIGTVETLPAESPATASMTGTPESPLLNLGIPQGASGSGGATDSQVTTAVNAWLTDHPEATTTVQDGAITTDKLADAAVTTKKLGLGTSTEYKNIPYFTGTSPGVSTSAVYGTFGQIIPVKPGKTYYCSFALSTQNITKVQILSAMPDKQYGALKHVVGTIDPSDDGVYTVPSDLTDAKAAFFPIKFYFMRNYDDEQAGVDALNNGTTGVNATRRAGNIIQDVPFDVIPSYYGRQQAASMLVDTDKNQVLYASLYAAVSDLVGARVAVLGDSLTEQSAGGGNKGIMDGVTDGEYYGDGWFTRIARKYLIKWCCKGYGAQWWYSTDARPNGATKQVRDLIDGTVDYDYIILEYGTNDILSGTLGTADDEASETATTTVGAIKWCIEQLQTRFPSARIIVIMPCLHNGTDGSPPARQTTYIDLVDPILRGYSVRRVYMADDSGITKAMMDTDGIHLHNPYVVNDITYYTNDTEAVRRYSKCLEAEMLKA